MDDEERQIAAGYRNWFLNLLPAAPVVAATVADLTWVVAVSSAIAIFLLNDHGARLHDLCVRLRRTNILLGKPDRTGTGG